MYLLKLNANYVITDPKGFIFHYVSIKTHCAQIIYNELRKFTFHYVKTIMHSVSHVFMLHLHSTMYLLKLVTSMKSSNLTLFTFHYISIKTMT